MGNGVVFKIALGGIIKTVDGCLVAAGMHDPEPVFPVHRRAALRQVVHLVLSGMRYSVMYYAVFIHFHLKDRHYIAF
jgi:hypothetical protein